MEGVLQTDLASDADSSYLKIGKWWIGVICVILATFCSALGETLLTKARILHENMVFRFGTTVPLYKSPLYLIGLGFSYLLHVPLLAVALAFASQSLIAPLQGLALVWHSLFARLILRESFAYQYGATGNFLILCGCVLCVVWGSHALQSYTEKQIFSFFKEPAFLAFISVTVFALLVLYCGRRYTTQTNFHPSAFHLEVMSESGGLPNDPNIGLGGKWRSIWRRVCFSSVGGVLGGLSNMLIKAWLEMFKTKHYSLSPFSWIVGLVGGVLMLIQRAEVNRALNEYDPILVVPIYYASLVAITTVSSFLFFQEWNSLGFLQSVLFPAGVAFVIAGIFFRTDKPRDYQVIADVSPPPRDSDMVKSLIRSRDGHDWD